MANKSTFVHKPDDIPRQEHWAIITGSSVHHEGDERSRTAPGHGYPAYTENVIEYEAFLDENEFMRELTRRFNSMYGSDRLIGLHVDKLYTKQTVVKVLEQVLPTEGK